VKSLGISHAPIQYRILDLVSANTEQEEAAFNFMKKVSKHASNHHPDNILLTSFLRRLGASSGHLKNLTMNR